MKKWKQKWTPSSAKGDTVDAARQIAAVRSHASFARKTLRSPPAFPAPLLQPGPPAGKYPKGDTPYSVYLWMPLAFDVMPQLPGPPRWLWPRALLGCKGSLLGGKKGSLPSTAQGCQAFCNLLRAQKALPSFSKGPLPVNVDKNLLVHDVK